jgi:hypothetical protein
MSRNEDPVQIDRRLAFDPIQHVVDKSDVVRMVRAGEIKESHIPSLGLPKALRDGQEEVFLVCLRIESGHAFDVLRARQPSMQENDERNRTARDVPRRDVKDEAPRDSANAQGLVKIPSRK